MKLEEFKSRFSTNKQCLDYLYNLRWANGFRCPRCNFNESWEVSDYKYKCKKCHYQSTVTSGTLFQDTHIPLTIWFKAVWYITSNKKVTAAGLQKELDLGSNRTALLMINKLKHAMVSNKQEKLCGIVEIERKPIRIFNKLIYFIFATEISDNKIGKIKISPSKELDGEKLNNFVSKHIENGSTLICKKWNDFDKLIDNGYIYKKTQDTYSYRFTNKVSLKFQSWLNENFSKNNKIDYVKVFCYEFNKYKSKLSFEEMLNNAVNLKPLPYGG